MEPLANELFTNLFNVLDRPVSEENEYIAKCMMRVFQTLQERVMPYLSVALPKLTEKMKIVAKNPSKPHFNHYLFEIFSLAIK